MRDADVLGEPDRDARLAQCCGVAQAVGTERVVLGNLDEGRRQARVIGGEQRRSPRVCLVAVGA
ncbi:MAG TPA: hypothetical protein VMI73_00125 [Trebonia sp.]|nr:hypothetical protein [Trebonia sp.]